MSALLPGSEPGPGRPIACPRWPGATRAQPVAVVLLGTGMVGGAFLRLLETPAAAHLHLVGVANSRHQETAPDALASRQLRDRLHQCGEPRDDRRLLAALDARAAAGKVIIDATASAVLAACHPQWLARGYHVVTANKTLGGGALSGWLALQRALTGPAGYGDSATVGAGLPVLSTLARLRRCGDALVSLEGVFSGSLSWLFNRYDGTRPFSALLLEARRQGLTEPDPRLDLAGEDVARKLLILGRHAGFPLQRAAVEVQGLVPGALQSLALDRFLQRVHELDAPLAARHAQAATRGQVLRFLARLDPVGRATVGLTGIPASHPAARLCGSDNQFVLTTARYRDQPLVIQGPGAGPEVTAQALLGDVLALT